MPGQTGHVFAAQVDSATCTQGIDRNLVTTRKGVVSLDPQPPQRLGAARRAIGISFLFALQRRPGLPLTWSSLGSGQRITTGSTHDDAPCPACNMADLPKIKLTDPLARAAPPLQRQDTGRHTIKGGEGTSLTYTYMQCSCSTP